MIHSVLGEKLNPKIAESTPAGLSPFCTILPFSAPLDCFILLNWYNLAAVGDFPLLCILHHPIAYSTFFELQYQAPG
jgi:hypothetical protein